MSADPGPGPSDAARLDERPVAARSPIAQAFAGGAALAVLVALISLTAAGIVGTTVVVLALVNLVAVLGLGVFTGNSGVLNFGHAAFFGIGAYATSLLTMDRGLKELELPSLPHWLASVSLPLEPGLLVAALFCGAVALVMGLPLMRMTVMGAAIATLGLLVIVYGVLVGADQFTNGAQAFYGVNVDVGLGRAVIYAGIAIVLARVFRESRLGLQLRAAREDPLAARSMGVGVGGCRLTAWVAGAMLAGIAGGLYAHTIGSFAPSTFYLSLTFALIVMLIVGGSGTVVGCVAGTVTVTVLTECLRRLEGTLQSSVWPDLVGLTDIGLALMLLVIITWRPGGLFAARELDEILRMAAGRAGRVGRGRRGAPSAQEVQG